MSYDAEKTKSTTSLLTNYSRTSSGSTKLESVTSVPLSVEDQEKRESGAGRMDPSVLPPDLVACRDLGFLILGGVSGEKGVG